MQLKIRNLSKTYANGVVALDRVTLTIPAGMFGLLGPNGAGKSTLMRILATLQECDAGSVFLDDIDVLDEKDAVRRMLGYLPAFIPRSRPMTCSTISRSSRACRTGHAGAKSSTACCSRPICGTCARSALVPSRAACASASASLRPCWATRV
jgi:ABC-type multidrug transport system ATPase subunit